MRISKNSLVFGLAAIAVSTPQPALAQEIDFGDDASMWANDGECDDMRFVGPGMTETRLLESDVGHDATDCRTAFEDGKLTLRADTSSSDSTAIDWGDDASEWANDGECDDKRFVGPGMTATRLLDSDVRHDATDCRTAFEAGKLTLRSDAPRVASSSIDWGDDASQWANDGECDDRRFTGPGMTATPLLDSDIRHDATDCRTAYEAGQLSLRDHTPAPTPVSIPSDIDWGTNTSEWANDGECDDARFSGAGLASSLLVDNIGKDAADCRSASGAGKLTLNPFFAAPDADSGINYGDDSATFANDGECDDVRFTGDYAKEVIFLIDDIGRDASDCRKAVESGEARWQGNDLPLMIGMIPET